MSITPAPIAYRVDGMTCAHCASAITSEVTAVPGVDGVEVDLGAGIVTVTGDAAGDEAAIAAGVEEAGYTLVGRAQ